MLMKKQTIWLMTMLSLIAVLSVYYLTTPEVKMTETITGGSSEKKSAKAVVKEEAEDPVLAQLRLQIDESRSRQKELLQEVVATTSISEEERSQAYANMQEITNVSSTEDILETLIKSDGYDDALVKFDEQKVHVTVKSENNSPNAANKIVKIVTNEIGHYAPVTVEFVK